MTQRTQFGACVIVVAVATLVGYGHAQEVPLVPAPEGKFSLYIRAYWADKAILDGSWLPPNVEKQE